MRAFVFCILVLFVIGLCYAGETVLSFTSSTVATNALAEVHGKMSLPKSSICACHRTNSGTKGQTLSWDVVHRRYVDDVATNEWYFLKPESEWMPDMSDTNWTEKTKDDGWDYDTED